MAFHTLMLFSAFVAISVICIYAESTCPTEKNATWSYNTKLKNGPEYWGETFKNCYGQKQSPIDIVTANVEKDKSLGKLQLKNYDVPVTKFHLENNGHTVKVTPADGTARSLLINGKTYTLDHFHFHWGDKYSRGSEHTINDKQYQLELHLVHFDFYKQIAVVGVFYKSSILSEFSSNGLTPITNALKRVPYKGDKVELTAKLNLDKLLRKQCSYFRYDGSLTTPGCNEGVTWSLCKEPMNIAASQMSEFKKLYSTGQTDEQDISKCKITNNFRPTQPLNDRIVKFSP